MTPLHETAWRSSLGALIVPFARVVGEGEHDAAADFGRVLVAAIAQDDDAELARRDHADIGRGIVDPAVLLDDVERAFVNDLPAEPLAVAWRDPEGGALRERHRLRDGALDRQFAE